MILSRRGFLAGLGAALAAPAVIRTPGLLMPVRSIVPAIEPLLLLTPPPLVMEYEFTTENLLAKMTKRYSCSWSDWRNTFGTPGV